MLQLFCRRQIGIVTNMSSDFIRRVWRYQRGNQNPYSKEEQTTQWTKEKAQKDKQRTPLKTGGELRCSGRV